LPASQCFRPASLNGPLSSSSMRRKTKIGFYPPFKGGSHEQLMDDEDGYL
jgi:hypothetical protein